MKILYHLWGLYKPTINCKTNNNNNKKTKNSKISSNNNSKIAIQKNKF